MEFGIKPVNLKGEEDITLGHLVPLCIQCSGYLRNPQSQSPTPWMWLSHLKLQSSYFDQKNHLFMNYPVIQSNRKQNYMKSIYIHILGLKSQGSEWRPQ